MSGFNGFDWPKVQTPTLPDEAYGVYEFRQGGGGADIGPLNSGMNVPIAGLSPDSQRYFDVHHARNDVFEAVHFYRCHRLHFTFFL